MSDEKICICYHKESEHGDKYTITLKSGEVIERQRCSGEVYDQGANIGCYCPLFQEKTPEWVTEQNKRSLERLRKEWSKHSLLNEIWGAVKELFGVYR